LRKRIPRSELRLCKRWDFGRFASEVAKDLQKAIRMESADEYGMCVCVTCGKRQHYKEMDAGHYISRKHTAALLVEDNIHVQCKHCNNWLGGNLDAYAEYLTENYGPEKIAELRKLKHSDFEYTREQLADLRDGYKARIKKQESRLFER